MRLFCYCMSNRSILVFSLIFCNSTYAIAGLSKSLIQSVQKDTICKVWVCFTEKLPNQGSFVTPEALTRRHRAGFDFDYRDLQVNTEYIKKIEDVGGVLKNVFKWENSASFLVKSSLLPQIAALPFVKDVKPVLTFIDKLPPRALSKTKAGKPVYGGSFGQLNMISVTDAQDYLFRFRNMPVPGKGVRIAFFDCGFRLDHKCFSYVREHKTIIASRDFVDGDTTVSDPDSVQKNFSSPYYANDEHGTCALSLVAGYDPGAFMGVAYGAQFVLARTEDGATESHKEEDNWAAAVVWAESLGVNIISSSLGYLTDFVDTISDGRNDYTYSDLDGKTTIVSRAAKYAIERGMIVVNAIGNEGSNTSGTLGAPADVDGVIAVGAVTQDEEIAYFSSTGPTADGRIKPEVVAQGVGVTLPVIYRSGYGSYADWGSGTSFSTPMVAGICALILQSHDSITSQNARDVLLKSCKFLPGQTKIDNQYGHGLPDAVISCMGDKEIYLSLADSSGKPVENALVSYKNGDSLCLSDSSGTAFFNLSKGSVPCSLSVKLNSGKTSIRVDSLPFHRRIVMPVEGLEINLLSENGDTIKNGKLYAQFDNSGQFLEHTPDNSGHFILRNYIILPVALYAMAPGYSRSDTIRTELCGELCTRTIKMKRLNIPEFVIFPSVVKVGGSITIWFTNTQELQTDNSIIAEIRTLDGRLVWKEVQYAAPYQVVDFKWDLRKQSEKIVPSVYFALVRCKNKIYKKKFLIAG
jgi:serine protease AprX